MLNSKVNWKEGVGFEGLRASQLHVQPRTQQNRKLVLREGGVGGGGRFKIALAVKFHHYQLLAQMPCLVHGSGVSEPRAFRDKTIL